MDELGVRGTNGATNGVAVEGRREGPQPDGGDTWVLQGEAAARTGFSVSAIRKWRRMGVVADRKITTASGFERVEVKLEDVLARAALQPERRRPEPLATDAQAPSGSVVITIDDLEALFERMVEAERRAENAEAELESLRAQSRFTFGQISELRRQLQSLAGQPASGPAAGPGIDDGAGGSQGDEGASPAPGPPPAASPPAAVAEAGPPRVRLPVPVSREGVTPVPRVTPRSAPARGPGGAEATGNGNVGRPPSRNNEVDELVAQLRRSYSRLDDYRRQEVISPAAERERQRELAAYDRVLLTVCRALGIPTGITGDQPVTLKARAALTRALVQAGFDVRAGVAPGSGARRPAAFKRRA